MKRITMLTVAAVVGCLCIQASAEEAHGPTGYVGVEWNAFGIGDHVSNGPGIQAGLYLFDGYLKVGIYAFGRPGPINGKTFNVALDEPYKGQSSVDLRSDGAFVGVSATPVIPLSESLALELPVSAGQAAFGFYLTGQDRETPDGRRVSEWENELFDGRDSSFAFGVQAGARLTYKIGRGDWLQPYVGGAWLWTPGYDAIVTNDYGGPSFNVGTAFVF